MRAYLALFMLMVASAGCFAGEPRNEAIMLVKPNSIWFQDADKLTQWQKLKKSGDFKALASFQEDVLRERDAWQFIAQLTVKILDYEPARNQVNVEMQTTGRMAGTRWFLDTDALLK